MKSLKYIILLSFIFGSCKKNIDLYPLSNLNTGTYYSNLIEIQTALTGAYNGLQKPLLEEWKMTELRSDNVIMGSAGSTSSVNKDLSDLDLFIPNTSHQGIYNYWISSYYNIRNVNIILNSLNVNYKESTGAISIDNATIPVGDADRKSLSAEATFIRAYHYFNLVRLFGGLFLVHEPLEPVQATTLNRSSTDEIYKLIIADLQNTITNGNGVKFASIASANLGRANTWCAKALLAKVYLTLNKKADAIPLLKDIIANSGYSLQSNYANIFSTANEMNSEIMFAIRYKAGGIALGSTFPNLFAPENSGAAVVNGDGKGYNYPSTELNNAYTTINAIGNTTNASATVTLTVANPAIITGMFVTGTGIAAGVTVKTISGTTLTLSAAATSTGTSIPMVIGDQRKIANIGVYPTGPKLYPKKLVSAVAIVNDAENDWIVIRYADVTLMLAEAEGNVAASLTAINTTRVRAGLAALTTADVSTTALFENALATERRLEFAFENVRWFDMMRFTTTLPTLSAESTLKSHFEVMYPTHYGTYPAPRATLPEIQGYVTTNRFLLPIPQREIDNNTTLKIIQNPGY